MSHLDEQQSDAQLKNMSKNKTQKTFLLLDYIGDPKREDSLIGLQYVVEVKMLESDKSFVKCNLCSVKGQMATMKDHLISTNHIKAYMDKYYYTVLQSLKSSCQNMAHFNKLLKDYAKEIERAEGTQGSHGIKIEYVSAEDMKKEQDELSERLEFHAELEKFPVLDKRHMALKYSENFKILSWEEATIVLNLTQQLSDQLEQYFLNGPDVLDSQEPNRITTESTPATTVLDSTEPNRITTESTPATTNFSQNVYENLHHESSLNQGLKSVSKEIQWHTEEPSSSSVCTPTRVRWFDTVPVNLEDTRRLKRKQEMSDDAWKYDVYPESSRASEFQSIQKRPHRELANFSTMNDMGSPQQSSTEVSSSQSSSIAANYTHISIPKEKSCVPETFGGEMQVVKDTPQNSISLNTLNDSHSKIEVVKEIKSLNDTTTAETADLGAEKHTTVPGLSSSTSSCSSEPSSQKPSSSHTHGKTSKSLSPELLQLLKGKDANTVTNILRTISPFYPALQEINLEILAQVLINTGALD